MVVCLKRVSCLTIFFVSLSFGLKAQTVAPLVTGNTLVCYGDSTTLTASVFPNDSSVTYKWYDDPLGGILLHDGNPYTTGPITVAKTIYCESWKNGIPSLIRTPVVILEVANVDVPTAAVSPASFCPGDTVTLTGFSLTGSTQFNWYDDLLDPTPIHSGNPFVAPISGTTLFHLESINSFGCRSVRAPVLVTVLPNLDVPLADADPTFICLGDTSEVEAYSLNGSSTFHWYEDALDPTPIFTGNPFHASPNSTETYFVSSETQFGCESIRTPVTVVVRKNLDLPSITLSQDTICAGDSVFMHAASANGSNQFRWYNSLVGGTLLFTGATVATVLHTATTFFVQTIDSNGCTSVRIPVSIHVNSNLDVPTYSFAPTNFCAGDTVTLTGSSPFGHSIFHWYHPNDTTNAVFTGNPFVTPVVATTNFQLSTRSDEGCESPRTPVLVSPTPNGDLVSATVSDFTPCARDTVQFSATSLNGNSTFHWYDAPNNGNLLHTGANFFCEIVSDTTLYVASQSANGCESSKTAVAVSVVPNNDVASASASQSSVCPGNTVTFTGSTTNGSASLNWFTTQFGGTPIHTGQIMTQVISSDTTFYLESTNNAGCGSVRFPITVATTPNADAPTASSNNATVCSGDSAEFTGVSANGSTGFYWYLSPTGGQPFDSSATVQLEVTFGAQYYLETRDANGCESVRFQVPLTSFPAPAIPTSDASPSTICSGDTSVLSAQSATGNTTFNWYALAQGGFSLHSGATFSVAPAQSTAYFVEAESSDGCKSLRTSVQVQVNVNNDVPAISAPQNDVCLGDSIQLTGASQNGSTLFFWYNQPIGGAVLSNAHSLTPTITADTVFYLETIDADGCISARTSEAFSVVINTTAAIISSNTSSLCAADSVFFNAFYNGGNGNFEWFSDSASTNSLGVGASLGLFVSDSTNVYLVGEDAYGCISPTAVYEIPVTPNTDSIGLTVLLDTVCLGTTVEMLASVVGSNQVVSWFSDTSTSNGIATGNAVSFNVTSDTTFYAVTENSTGCLSDVAALSVMVAENVDQLSIQALSDTVCEHLSAELSGQSASGNDLFWYDAAVGGNLLQVGPQYAFELQGNSTVYMESRNSKDCPSDRISKSLFFNAAPTVSVSAAQVELCAGNTAMFEAATTNSSDLIAWYSDLPAGNVVFEGNVFQTDTLYADQSFMLVVTDEDNCSSLPIPVNAVVLTELALDKVNPTCSSEAVGELTISWEALANAVDYEVSLDAQTFWASTDNQTVFTFSSLDPNAEHQVYVRAIADPELPCVMSPSEISQALTCKADGGKADSGEDITIPYTSFSPNGDGYNDYWDIGEEVTLFSDNQVQIFNRIGESVFSTEGYDNQSNVFTGEGLADGTYYYVVNIPSIDFSQTGYIILIR